MRSLVMSGAFQYQVDCCTAIIFKVFILDVYQAFENVI